MKRLIIKISEEDRNAMLEINAKEVACINTLDRFLETHLLEDPKCLEAKNVQDFIELTATVSEQRETMLHTLVEKYAKDYIVLGYQISYCNDSLILTCSDVEGV